MDIVRIKNLKCIEEFDLQLDKITVLTGVNSSGKSTVVQALLLLKKSFDVTSNDGLFNEKEISCPDFFNVPSFDFVVRRDAEIVSISGDFGFVEYVPAEKTLIIRRYNKGGERVLRWLESEDFVYLNAERIGPRWESELSYDSGKYCGVNGEFTASRLNEVMKAPKVDGARLCPDTTTENFQIQVDKWMSYIFGDVSFKAKLLSDKFAQILVRQPMGLFPASSVGFGYIYALPIVLDGLRIPAGSMMIVENPEAHLHPKAQSNIGYFLGTLAAAGVRVVVETHSEHVVNGIRRAAVSGIGLMPEDMKIYFFSEKTDSPNPHLITMDEEGDLSEFPVDFFDQVRQDMKEIWRLIKENKID